MRDLIPNLQVPITTIISAPLMFVLFIGIVYLVYKRTRKDVYLEAEKLPLD